jgi:Flp pilus assembly protein TadB
VIILAALAAMLAAACLGGSRRPSGRRLLFVLEPVGRQVSRPLDGTGRRRWVGVRIAGAVVGLGVGRMVVGGQFGWAVGVIAGVAAVVFRSPARRLSVNPDDVAVVVDLVAGCLAAGTGLAAALDAASAAADDELRARCLAVAGALRSGIPAAEAWHDWLADPWLAPVARTAVRTTNSGAAAAADLQRTAARLRSRRRAAAQHKVRQASVWLVAPLGLCFLPAFVLVAVVPLVLGLVPSLRG